MSANIVMMRGGNFNRDRLTGWMAYADTQGITVEGRGTWRSAMCDFHDDAKPSMRVNTLSGGWCCMSCGASGGDVLAHYMARTGMGFIAAAKALGAWVDTGEPARPQRPRTLSAHDALALLYEDATTLWILACDIGQGKTLTESERAAAAAIARRSMIAFEGVNK